MRVGFEQVVLCAGPLGLGLRLEKDSLPINSSLHTFRELQMMEWGWLLGAREMGMGMLVCLLQHDSPRAGQTLKPQPDLFTSDSLSSSLVRDKDGYLFPHAHNLLLTVKLPGSLVQIVGNASFHPCPCCHTLVTFQWRWLGIPPLLQLVDGICFGPAKFLLFSC